MGVYAELLKKLETRCVSPDGHIRAMRKDKKFYMAFEGETYYRYSKYRLCGQLEALCQLMWVRHRKGVLKAASTAFGYEATGRDFPDDPTFKAYYNDRDNIDVIGDGSKSMIVIRNIGWTNWSVHIEDHAPDKLSDNEFIAEFISAADDMLRDYQMKLSDIKDRHFPDVRNRGLALDAT